VPDHAEQHRTHVADVDDEIMKENHTALGNQS